MTERVKVAPRSPSEIIEKLPDGTSKLEFGGGDGISRLQDTSSCRGIGYGKIRRHTNSSLDFYLKAQDYEMNKACPCLRRVRSIRVPYNILNKENRIFCDTDGLRTGLCRGDNGGQLMCDGWLRAISSAVVYYETFKGCVLQAVGKGGHENECGSTTSLNVFTDLCSYNVWLRDHIPDYPSMDNNCEPNHQRFSEKSFY